MAISASQRKALEAAGYTVNKAGTSVQSASGGSVGGINANGQVWSGSAKVKSILKGGGEAPAKAAPRAAAPAKAPARAARAPAKAAPKAPARRATPPKSSARPAPRPAAKPKAPAAAKRPAARPTAKVAVNAASTSRAGRPASAIAARMQGPAAPTRAKAPKARPAADVTFDQWKAMTRTERKNAGLPVSHLGGEIGFKRFQRGFTGKDYTMKRGSRK